MNADKKACAYLSGELNTIVDTVGIGCAGADRAGALVCQIYRVAGILQLLAKRLRNSEVLGFFYDTGDLTGTARVAGIVARINDDNFACGLYLLGRYGGKERKNHDECEAEGQ